MGVRAGGGSGVHCVTGLRTCPLPLLRNPAGSFSWRRGHTMALARVGVFMAQGRDAPWLAPARTRAKGLARAPRQSAAREWQRVPRQHRSRSEERRVGKEWGSGRAAEAVFTV